MPSQAEPPPPTSLRPPRKAKARPSAGLALLLAFGLALPTLAAAQDSLRVQLKWTHQFQFAGYYMAQELGYYREAGLAVSLLEGGPGISDYEAVLEGRADLAICDEIAILKRLEGEPLVLVASLFQHSPYVVLTTAQNSIKSANDLLDKAIVASENQGRISLKAMLEHNGLDPGRIRFVPNDGDALRMIRDSLADATTAYASHEMTYFALEGLKVVSLPAHEQGADFYGDLVVCHEDLRKRSPKAITRFWDATRRGWEQALADPQRAAEVAILRYGARLRPEQLVAEALAMRHFVEAEVAPIGTVKPERVEDIARTIVRLYPERELDMARLDGFVFAPRTHDERLLHWLLGLAVLAALLVGGVVLWNRQLQRKVQQRTMMLKEALQEQQATQEKLRQAQREAEQANALKSAFLANLSHEIRTPMNGIIGFAAMIRESPGLPQRALKYLDIIDASGNQLLHVINDMVELSQLHTQQVEFHKQCRPLNPFLREIHDNFRMSLSRESVQRVHLVLYEAIDSDEFQVCLDFDRLRQILTHLLGNAIKFTEVGKVEFGYQLRGQRLEFYVEDTGIGIRPDQHERIFDIFHQADNSLSRNFGGTGIGLSICKALVEGQGGSIRLESTVGVGSRFHFDLPLETV